MDTVLLAEQVVSSGRESQAKAEAYGLLKAEKGSTDFYFFERRLLEKLLEEEEEKEKEEGGA